MSTQSRPWQATALGVIGYFYVAYSLLVAASLIFGVSILSGTVGGAVSGATDAAVSSGELDPSTAGLAAGGIKGFFGALGVVGGVVSLLVALIYYKLASGVMAGKKWTLIAYIVFGIFGLSYFMSPSYDIKSLINIVLSIASVILPITVYTNTFFTKAAVA